MGVQKEILTRSIDSMTYTAADGTSVTITGKTGTLALGVPGNIFDASPARIHTAVLTQDYDIGTCVGGEGIIVNPREYALKGEAGNPLAPSLTLTAGMVASFMTFGHVVTYLREANANLDLMEGHVLVGAPAEYDASADYAVGDLVTHDDEIFKCTTAITGGEVWTSAHWKYLDDADTDITDLCVLEVNGLK